eukprot:CAMPEP_0198438338 /NCGR_PEP_ID=MMETSP1452-20131203/50560_1 /TAXON_ID=1181717 /ORGANISM="Synchroma pusillum, Strain CCMP3072" /LENGTH=65 /DNA_ID=CAMNT_0044158917 /DNA_START=16 /DNA_END=209 /DNA_ORIENTATION=+
MACAQDPVVAPKPAAASGLNLIGLVSLVLLALQYGLQPLLSKSFISASTPRQSIVIVAELVKIVT